ncbi:hypothetical protein [Microbulbifer epialgicus]|uniref:Uncharacterized protein n=1 Tax=Microbulbifer epialgicus TaxID=393907 RepID=A0ABV4P1N2_9GAMM
MGALVFRGGIWQIKEEGATAGCLFPMNLPVKITRFIENNRFKNPIMEIVQGHTAYGNGPSHRHFLGSWESGA